MKPNTSAPERSEKPVVSFRARGVAELTPEVVDLNDLNSPHTLAVLSVPPGATVLDVGCGPGVVARALAARGCRVWGLEVDAHSAARARAHCVEVVEADVESVPLPSALSGLHFDAVLCLDVLEHLREPAVVLATLGTRLAPGGIILISVPNVTHGALRLELLKGRFAYRNSGLLDRGHLRFFTAATLQAMIRQAGLRAGTTLRVVKRLDQTEFDVDLESVPPELREELEADPDALTYQFFVVARPVREGQLNSEGLNLTERLHARVDQVTAELEKAGAYARNLEVELKAKDEQLRHLASEAAHLAHVTAELEKTGAYASRLEADLAASQSRAAELDLAAAHLGRELEVSRTRVTEQEQLVTDLRRLVDDNASYVHHLERELQRRCGDIAIRDDEMSVLRAHVEKAERAVIERESQVAQLQTAADQLEHHLHARGAHVAELEAYVRHLEAELQARVDDITIRDGAMNSLHAHIAEVERAVADEHGALVEQQTLASHLSWVVRQPRHLLAQASADALVARAPWLHRLLRPLVMFLLERWSRADPPTVE
jgi:2-polyprenyl-3-methyl-5-hydroxy-6-metoxy-1,4-benzoquinol methylase